MLNLITQLLFAAMELLLVVVFVAIVAFFLYMAVDYICDRIWGRPFLTEENRKKWWV